MINILMGEERRIALARPQERRDIGFEVRRPETHLESIWLSSKLDDSFVLWGTGPQDSQLHKNTHLSM